jgi:PASTA domain
MGSWPSAVLLRVAAIAALALFATATITFAASKKIDATTASPPAVTAPKAETLVVPDVRGQAYVFAKGILEDTGFAWHVSTKNGFAANTVTSQSPAPGTRVVDNGAPVVTLSLQKNPRYAEKGTAENDSPFAGTPLKLGGSSAPTRAPAAAPSASHKLAASPKPAAKPATAKPVAKPAQAKAATTARPPDFVVRGARKEPQNEMPLPERARLLGKWLERHRTPSDANTSHWLYQHQWIVTGAKFGWWHGAEALGVLIADDRRAQALWGVGSRSEAAARQALAEVEARAK